MIAGTLEIQMLANLARLQQDMDKAKSVVGGAMGNIEKAVASAKSALGALGIGLGVGYFISLIKGSIDAADRLNDLSKSTNIAVGDLAGLKLLAKQTGTDLDGLAGGILKMSVAMGKDPEKFKALGVTAKDNTEAFKQLADIFNLLPDIQQRNALSAAVFGKSWKEMAPALSEGGQKIGEIIEKGRALSGVNKEMADAADEFNDKLAELGGTSGILNRQVAPLLPLLNALADDMLDVQSGANGVSGSFSPLAEAFRAILVLGGNVAFVLKGIGTEIGGMAAQVAAFLSGDFKGASAIGDMMKKDAEAARAAFDSWENKMMDAGKTAKATGATVVVVTGEMTDAQKKAVAAAAAFLETQKKQKDEYAAVQKSAADFIKTLEKEATQLGMTADQKKLMDAATVMLTLHTEKERRVFMESATAAAQKIKVFNEAAAAAKFQADGVKRLTEEAEKYSKVLQDSVDADQKSLDAMTLKNDLLEKGIESVTAMAVAELEAKLASADYTTATYEEIAALEKRLDIAKQINAQAGRGENIQAARDAAKQMDADWKKSVEQYDDVFRKGFADMVNGGTATWKSFTKSLTTTFKTTVADQIYKMFAQPFVVKIVASLLGITGGAGMSGVANAASGGSDLLSMGSNAYSLFNGGMSVMGDYVLGSMGIGSGLSQGAMLAAQTAEFGLAGAATTAEALGGVAGSMGGLTTALAAIPVWGWAAMAAVAAYAIFSKPGGGPKTEGNAYGTIGADGSTEILRSASFAAPYGDGDWGRPGSDAASVESMLQPVGKSISEYIGKLGGSAAGLGLTLGYNTDPQGTAPDNVSAGVMGKNGEWAYRSVYDAERGKGAEAMQGELAKMTLAAVQSASGLSDGLLEIANSVDVTTASVSDATAVLDKIGNLQTVNKILTDLHLNLFEVSLAGSAMSESLISAMGGIQQMTATTQSYYTNFFSDTERHANDLEALGSQFSALGVTLPTTRDGFRELVESQDLSTDSGRAMTAALLGLNGAFAAVVPATESAAAAIAEIGRTAAEIASQNYDLQTQLLQVQGDTATLRARELALLDASNQPLQQQIWNLQDKAEIASQNYDLQTQLLQVQGDTVALRVRELALLDASNQPLQQQIWNLQDKKVADEAAASAASTAASAASTAASAAQQAADQQAAAQKQIVDGWQNAANSIVDTMKKLRGDLLGPSAGFAAAQADFAISTAQARAGDMEAAKSLPALAQAVVDLGKAVSITSLDQALLTARTLSSLSTTAQGMSRYGITIPAFASGGNHAGGWATVGEQGPELVHMPAGRVFNNGDTSRMLDNAEMVTELKALRAEVASLRKSSSDTAETNKKISDLLLRVTRDGESLVTVAA